MKVTNTKGVDVTQYVIALLEEKITNEEFKILIDKKHK